MHSAITSTDASPVPLRPGAYRKWMLKVAGALICFWTLWRVWPADSRIFYSVGSRPGLLLAAIVLRPVFTMILALRTTVLASALSSPAPRARSVIRLTFVSQMFNLVMPGGVGGDVARGVMLRRLNHSPWAKVVGVLVLDRIVGLVSLFLVVLVCAFPLLLRHWSDYLTLVLFLALFTLLAVMLAIRAGEGRRLRDWLRLQPWACQWMEVAESLSLRKLAGAILLAFLAHGCLLFSCGLIFDSCGFAVPWGDRIGVLALSFLAASLPLTIGGHGVREGALVWLLSTGAINAGGPPLLPREDAIVVAITLLCILIVTNFTTGVLALMFEEKLEGRRPA